MPGRAGRRIGFRAEVHRRERDDGEILRHVLPEDLIKFGLIPEFIGRLPVVAVLEELDKQALVQILSKPKNAIVRQYQKLFEFENVRLKFSDDALEAIADRLNAEGKQLPQAFTVQYWNAADGSLELTDSVRNR